MATRAGASLIMAGQNDHGRNQGLHSQARPHRGIVVLRAIEVDLDSHIGLAVVLRARIREGLLSDSEVPDRHRLTSEAWSSDRFSSRAISEANDKPRLQESTLPSRENIGAINDNSMNLFAQPFGAEPNPPQKPEPEPESEPDCDPPELEPDWEWESDCNPPEPEPDWEWEPDCDPPEPEPDWEWEPDCDPPEPEPPGLRRLHPTPRCNRSTWLNADRPLLAIPTPVTRLFDERR
jgi:hypothetical protein